MESAWRLAYYRGILSEQYGTAGSGGMMAVGMSSTEITHLISSSADSFRDINVACINSPKNVTMSGDREQLKALATLLRERGVFHRQLRVDVAYHSSQMNRIAAAYALSVNSLTPGISQTEPTIMISSVTGELAHPAALREVSY